MRKRKAHTNEKRQARWWLALVACVLVLGQSLVSAHAVDIADHAGERYCDVCLFASNAAGAPQAVTSAQLVTPPRALLRAPRALATAEAGHWPAPHSRAPPGKPTDR